MAAIRRAFTTGNFGSLARETADGRLQVHGIDVPKPASGRIVAETERLSFRESPQLVVTRKTSWHDVEFFNCRLPRTLLQGCSLKNVVFRQCELPNWRFFSVQARDCTFSDTNLQGTAFSVMADDDETVFSGCRFSRCDLRGTAYKRARFENCHFDHCRISGVNFSSTAFIDVTFSGEISDSQFYGVRPNCSQVNPMLRVDFSAAQLSWVEFWAIDLDKVRFPSGENNVTVENWPAFLDSLDEMTTDRPEMECRQVRAILELWRKWRGRDQNRGFINLGDIANDVGPMGVEIFKAAISSSRA